MRALLPLLLLPVLAGCGALDWDNLTSFGNSPRPEANTPAQASQAAQIQKTIPATQVTQAQAAPDPFCLAVAKQDATTQGFDQATEGRVAIRSYQQCVGLFGPSAGK